MPAPEGPPNRGVGMTYTERARRWNDWYDAQPDRWRFQLILWPLLLIGTINMMLTIATGFPFGLLVVLAIIVLAVVRWPHRASARPKPDADRGGRALRLGRADWVWHLNRRYDAMPEWRRFWVFPVVLIVAGAINMALTLAGSFPFALLFLLALLVLVALRAPYAWGWLTPPPAHQAEDRAVGEPLVGHDTTPAVPALASTPSPWLRPVKPAVREPAASATVDQDEPPRP